MLNKVPPVIAVLGAWLVAYVALSAFHTPLHGSTLALVFVFVGYIIWLTFISAQQMEAVQKDLQAQKDAFAEAQPVLSAVAEEKVWEAKNRAEFLLNQLTERGQNSIVGCRIRRLYALSRTHVSTGQTLSDLLTRREDLAPQGSRFTASILVFVALAGTVLCMGWTLAGLPKFDGSDTSMASLNNVVTQMLPAFFITFVGISCTVWLSMQNNDFTKRQDTFLLEVEEFTLDVLTPRLLANPSTADAARMEAVQKEMSGATVKLSELILAVKEELVQSIRDSMHATQLNAQEFQGKLLGGAESFTRDIQQAATDIAMAGNRLADSSDLATRNIEPALNAAKEAQQAAAILVEVSRESGAVIHASSNTLSVTLQEFSLSVKPLPDHLGALVAACDRMELAVTTLRGDQSAIRTGMTDASQAWQSVGQQLDALAEIMKQTFVQVQQTLDGVGKHFVSEQTAFMDAMHSLRDVSEKSQMELAGMQQQMLEGVEIRFEGATDKYADVTNRTFDAMYRQLQDLMAQFTPALESLQVAARELQQTTNALQNVADAKPLAAASQLLANLPTTMSQALYESGPASDLRNASQSLQTAANTCTEWTEQVSREMLTRMDTLTQVVVSMRDQMPPTRARRAPKNPEANGVYNMLSTLNFWKRKRP